MMGHMRQHMKQMGHHMGQKGHHTGCACPMCADNGESRKKMLMAMVFFGAMAIINLFIVGMLHLMLHAKEAYKE